jgi:hypothetical protein
LPPKQCGYGFVYYLDVDCAVRAVNEITESPQQHDGVKFDCHLSYETENKLRIPSSLPHNLNLSKSSSSDRGDVFAPSLVTHSYDGTTSAAAAAYGKITRPRMIDISQKAGQYGGNRSLPISPMFGAPNYQQPIPTSQSSAQQGGLYSSYNTISPHSVSSLFASNPVGTLSNYPAPPPPPPPLQPSQSSVSYGTTTSTISPYVVPNSLASAVTPNLGYSSTYPPSGNPNYHTSPHPNLPSNPVPLPSTQMGYFPSSTYPSTHGHHQQTSQSMLGQFPISTSQQTSRPSSYQNLQSFHQRQQSVHPQQWNSSQSLAGTELPAHLFSTRSRYPSAGNMHTIPNISQAGNHQQLFSHRSSDPSSLANHYSSLNR